MKIWYVKELASKKDSNNEMVFLIRNLLYDTIL